MENYVGDPKKYEQAKKELAAKDENTLSSESGKVEEK